MITRHISISKQTSSIWFGPRQTGKSTLVREALKDEKYFEVNLLDTQTFRRYLITPELFATDIEFQIQRQKIKFVFVDEIQKIPQLTNDVHALIEKYKKQNIHFILSGSSARKLKRGNANLLGGRAILCHLFPLTMKELMGQFDLETVLHHGSLVGIYFDSSELRVDKLKSYVDLYLREEVAQEGLVRNYELFNRFFDVAGVYAAEIINYSNIAREVGTSHKTVQSYFQILTETLLSYELPAWDKSIKRQLSKHSKFYFCDNGIHQGILGTLTDKLSPVMRGKMFEQWLLNEIRATISYQRKEFKMHYWRTERGEYEVDLVLSKASRPQFAIEFKAKKRISRLDLKSLREFSREYPKAKLYCLYEGSAPYSEEGVTVLPYDKYADIFEAI